MNETNEGNINWKYLNNLWKRYNSRYFQHYLSFDIFLDFFFYSFISSVHSFLILPFVRLDPVLLLEVEFTKTPSS